MQSPRDFSADVADEKEGGGEKLLSGGCS